MPEAPLGLAYAQDENTLKAWVDAHWLKKIEDTWYKDGRQVVTGGLWDKRTIIKAHHDAPVHGHPGIKRTVQLTERAYWWLGMRQDVQNYVQGCAECQRHKINNRPIHAPFSPIYPMPEAMCYDRGAGTPTYRLWLRKWVTISHGHLASCESALVSSWLLRLCFCLRMLWQDESM